jgi:hypothetical protein
MTKGIVILVIRKMPDVIAVENHLPDVPHCVSEQPNLN